MPTHYDSLGTRPRASTVERSREIREVAARYVAAHGLWRFNLKALARHLDCLLPTLSYYYRRREDLVTDVALHHIESLLERTSLAVARGNGPADELRAFADAYLRAAAGRPDHHRLTLIHGDLSGVADAAPLDRRRQDVANLAHTRLRRLGYQLDRAIALTGWLMDGLDGVAARPNVDPAAYSEMLVSAVLAQAPTDA